MTQPDVTVITAVYNTMPYLTRCLTSLLEQSIGRERMEIIAVDDGSTDGSGTELDRFARLHPRTVKVLHQPNSGGPAAPSNRALEIARGRYVFFVGSDDYLGREALERMVDAADRWASDVLICKLVGVNGRVVFQDVYARTEEQISLFDSAVPWALSNTKLFRRELIERYGLRYPQDMPVGSDQPFTLEALYRAGRISVLADYDYYFAVRRLNSHNLTYSTRHVERLRCAEQVVTFVAGLIEPGKQRDAVLVRHFTWEVAKLLEDDFLKLDRATQETVQAGVRMLAECYLTDHIKEQLTLENRLRLLMAQHGTLRDLLEVIRQDAERGVPATVVEGERWYATYPGFRHPERSFPDSWFEVTDIVADWLAKLDVTSVNWEDGNGVRLLAIAARSPRTDLVAVSSAPVSMTVADTVAVTLETSTDDAGTTVRARFRLDQLLTRIKPGGEARLVKVRVAAFENFGVAPIRAPRRPVVTRMICRRGMRLYMVTPTANHKGQLVVAITPVTPRRVIARLRRRWPQGGK